MSKLYKAVTKYVSDDVFESTVNGATVVMDTGSQEKQGQSPMELLLSAVAGCSSVDVIEIIKKRRKQIVDFRVEVDAVRRSEPIPKTFTDIKLTFILTSPDATAKELEQAVELSMTKYCSVSTMLKSSSDITYESKVISE